MLAELHIANLGVIEDLDLELHPGLNVLTGETGAGKTLVTLGLALALGTRAQAAHVRNGSVRARVEARFLAAESPSVEEWLEDGEVVLARAVSKEGRSTARIGGQMVPVSALAALGPELVEVHGQNQQQRLLAPGTQMEVLDRFAGAQHLDSVRAYAEAYERLRRVRTRLEEVQRNAREREREKDLLAYQVREIEAAGVRPGEIQEIAREESRLAHAERLSERAASAEALIGGEDGTADRLHLLSATLRDAAAIDGESADLADRAAALAADASELSRDLRAWREGLRVEPGRLEEINERLRVLRTLERKYGDGEEGILAFHDEAGRRLAGLSTADQERALLLSETEELDHRATGLARAISERRRDACPALSLALEAELRELGMEGASITVDVDPENELGPDGRDRVAVLFSGAPRQPALELAKGASGGELSRVMLACRSVMADIDRVPTLVFDEVDAGIGGRAGAAVGRRLARLATTRQVIVVTHLAQIACFADRHVRVTKQDGVAGLQVLEGDDRIVEIARMLSGSVHSETAESHARELLDRAVREREDMDPAREGLRSEGTGGREEMKTRRGGPKASPRATVRAGA